MHSDNETTAIQIQEVLTRHEIQLSSLKAEYFLVRISLLPTYLSSIMFSLVTGIPQR